MTDVDLTEIWLRNLFEVKNRLLKPGGGGLSGASAINYCSSAKRKLMKLFSAINW